jgi:hypothetical protein
MSRVRETVWTETVTSIREERMRAAFKVATVFTGAAACAAMFAPGAEAATTTKAQLMMPDTGHKDCAIGIFTTSAVFFWRSTTDHGPTCVGGLPNFNVPTSLGDNYFQSVCPGNNFLSITSEEGNGQPNKLGPATHRINLNQHVHWVNIFKWSHSDKCST